MVLKILVFEGLFQAVYMAYKKLELNIKFLKLK